MEKTILITGGSRGIGAACALLAAQRGYKVGINYRADADAAARVVTAIRDAGGDAIAIEADVSQEADVERMFATMDAHYGALTALVNNAGILATQMRVDQMDAARITRIMASTVVGSFLCAREAVRRMSTKHGGAGGGAGRGRGICRLRRIESCGGCADHWLVEGSGGRRHSCQWRPARPDLHRHARQRRRA